jgi:hypothetical protein
MYYFTDIIKSKISISSKGKFWLGRKIKFTYSYYLEAEFLGLNKKVSKSQSAH